MQDELKPWNTPISQVRHLCNPEMRTSSVRNLSIIFEDLDAQQKWECTFADVVGFRCTRQFHLKRLGNTFIVRESEWLARLLHEPMLVPGDLNGVNEYILDTDSAEIAVLAKREPTFRLA